MKRTLSTLLLLLVFLASPIVAAKDSWAKIYAEVMQKNTVRVQIEKDSSCTGIVIGTNEILTAAHCLVNGPGTKLSVEERPARIDGVLTVLDLAVLSSPLVGKEPIRFAARTPPMGTPVLSLGFAFGGEANSTASHVMAILPAYTRIDQPLQYGYSGGPTVNEKGELVGLNDMTNFMQGVGYLVPIERIRVFFDILKVGLGDGEREEN